MNENKETRIIEINGIKMEIDLRTAKRVENYAVGDNVKILIKGYSDYKSHIGTIIGFDEFKDHPTIVIAYLNSEYSSADIKFAYFNSETKDMEITTLNDWDIPFSKSQVLDNFNNDIKTAKQKVLEIENKAKIFETLFGKFFDSLCITNKC